MTFRSLVWIVLASSVFVGKSMAQSVPLPLQDSSHALLVVTTSPESAWVMVDSLVMGRTPCFLRVAAPAHYRLRIQHPDITNWLNQSVDDTVDVVPGQTVSRMYALEAWTLVVSSPMGAEIIAGDSILGNTPLIVRPGEISPTAPLTFRLQGYEGATANLGMAARGILRIPLRARPDVEPSFDQTMVPPQPSQIRLYLAGGGAVLAGAAAAYFKMKADDANNEYLLTKNPGSASDRDRFDTTSGVFLIVTQVSLGLFLAFLMSD
jgi:hypothetical protein